MECFKAPSDTEKHLQMHQAICDECERVRPDAACRFCGIGAQIKKLKKLHDAESAQTRVDVVSVTHPG